MSYSQLQRDRVEEDFFHRLVAPAAPQQRSLSLEARAFSPASCATRSTAAIRSRWRGSAAAAPVRSICMLWRSCRTPFSGSAPTNALPSGRDALGAVGATFPPSPARAQTTPPFLPASAAGAWPRQRWTCAAQPSAIYIISRAALCQPATPVLQPPSPASDAVRPVAVKGPARKGRDRPRAPPVA